MLRFPRSFIASNIAALNKSAGGGAATTTFNPSTTPAPGTTSGIAITGGDLTATGPSSSFGHAATIGSAPAGQLVYWEVTITKVNNSTVSVGVCNSSMAIGPGGDSWVGGGGATVPHNAMGLYDDQGVFKADVNGTVNDPNLALASGDTVGIELDVAGASLKFRKGSYLSAAFAVPTGTLYGVVGLDAATASAVINTGATAFVHAAFITSGYTGRLT